MGAKIVKKYFFSTIIIILLLSSLTISAFADFMVSDSNKTETSEAKIEKSRMPVLELKGPYAAVKKWAEGVRARSYFFTKEYITANIFNGSWFVSPIEKVDIKG